MNLSRVLLVPLCLLLATPLFARQQSVQSEAIQQSDPGTQEMGQDGEAEMTQGLSHYRRRDFQSALGEFDKVTEAAPWRADAFYLRGYCLMILRSYDQSVEAFGRAFELDPAFDPRTIYQR